MNPEHFILNDNEPAEYLCYTNAYYLPCVVQQPMLKTHIEAEIKAEIEEEVSACFGDLESSFEEEGYSVNIEDGDVVVELLPERIVTTLTHKLTLTRGDAKRYESFRIVLNNDLYELVSIARNIINWEATYGQAPETVYMDLYHDLKVEVHKRDDGSKVYILTNRDSQDKFQFASRSLVMK